MKLIIVLTFICLNFAGLLHAQKANIQLPEMTRTHSRGKINVPDIYGYKTLKCDFHMHTVFSDGIVWPDVRVSEAWEEGLDVISITDHIEGKYHEPFVSGSRNTSYEIALPKAKELGILLVKGAEITRSMPPGHLNVLFIQDIDKLMVPDAQEAIMEADRQGAFIFWNHPCWTAQQPDSCIMFQIHKTLVKNKVMRGIEVFNEREWYPVALDWCIENNLSVIATSDIHVVNSHNYYLDRGHRPMTLVFAKDTTITALKEALFAGRTVAWFWKYVAGREEFLSELFKKSITKQKSGNPAKGETTVSLKNNSDFVFEITSLSDKGKKTTINPAGMASIKVRHDEEFVVTNWFTGSERNLKVQLN